MFENRAHWTDKAFWWVAPLVLLASAGGGAWYYFHSRPAREAAKSAAKAAVAPTNAPPRILNPIPAATTAEGAALPALDASDAPLKAELERVIGDKAVADWLNPDSVVRHIVVTLDNLPRAKVAVEKRPLKAMPGTTVVRTQGDSVTLSNENDARYVPFVRLVAAADARAVAELYFYFYPLFQQAYEELGYPGQYFNDRLVAAIDDLLAAPEISGPIELVQPKVFFEYADPKLESRSAGQKLLIRMGPRNAAVIKGKLRELRALVAAGRAQLLNHRP